MAQGVTSSFTQDVSFSSKFEMTGNDDILNIIGATVSLIKPDGDLFTNAGNDKVLIEDSTLVAEGADFTLSLGSGNDTLTVNNSIISSSISAGSGDDIVTIAGSLQSNKKVRLNKKLLFGTGNDILEIVSILENAGSIDFGTDGNKILRFNGGVLLPVSITETTYGTLGSFSNLEVALSGGTTGCDLELAGEQTSISLSGSFFGSDDQKNVSISGGTTTLAVESNAITNVRLVLNNTTLVQTDGSNLEFSAHSGYAITANESIVKLHDIVVKGGMGLTGSSTTWSVENSDFSNSTNGFNLIDGIVSFYNGGMANYKETAMILSGTSLTGSRLSFMYNNQLGAIVTHNADVHIEDFRASNNAATNSSIYGGVIMQDGGSMTLSNASFSDNFAIKKGGAVYLNGGVILFDNATFSGNSSYQEASRCVISSASVFASASASASAYAYGGAFYQSGGYATISDTVFSGNVASASAFASAFASGLPYYVYSSGWFYGTQYITSQRVQGSASADAVAYAGAYGGAVYLIGATVNMNNTVFSNNLAVASASASNSLSSFYASNYAYAYGGGVYINKSILNYYVTSGAQVTNVGNSAQVDSPKNEPRAVFQNQGGWLYAKNESTVNITVDNNSLLTIGDSTGKDSIAGDSTCRITKFGTGRMVINSDISDYSGLWTVAEGTLELAQIARIINLGDWTIGTDATLFLSVENDVVNMNTSQKIGTIDMGGGSDTINTNSYDLTDGIVLLSDLTLSGGGRVSVRLRNRSTTEGSTLRLHNIYLDSEFAGNDYTDTIQINQESTLGGSIDLGNGNNVITAKAISTFKNTVKMGEGNDALTFTDVTFDGTLDLGGGNNTLTVSGNGKFKDIISEEGNNIITINGDAAFSGTISLGSGNDIISMGGASAISGEIALGAGVNAIHIENTLNADKVRITEGGKTSIYVYASSSITNNTLTVYSDEAAARDVITLDWSDQANLDKARILVSSDYTFKSFELSVELYNKSKSFTLNLQQGYFIQFQAQDEDGWTQRILADAVAPNQVTGVSFNGKTLSWNAAHDNMGGNGVKQYHVEISEDAAFSTITQSEIVEGTEFSPASLPEATLYFRVKAEDYTGNIGDWSETVSGSFDNTPPSRPSGGQSTVTDYSVFLSWSASTDTGSGVSSYEYRIATDSNYSKIVTRGTTETCSLTIDDLNYGSYYWQVRAVDAAGNVSDWSLNKNFATVDAVAPSVPTNLDYGIENGQTLTALWDATADDTLGSGVKGYEVQLASDADFTNIVKTVFTNVPEVLVDGLASATYYMRVRAVDNAENKSGWTETTSFIIERDTTAPVITLTGDIETPLQQTTLTASTDDGSGIIFRIGDGGEWTPYTGAITVSSNATYYFKATDASGNTGTAEIVFGNIDNEKPTISNITPSTTEIAQSVTVTATFSDNKELASTQYRIGDGAWTDYMTGVTVSENTTVYFWAIDTAGNETEASYVVSNIETVIPDTTKPTVSNVKANITTPTNQNVTVTAVFADDVAVTQALYKLGSNGIWTAYPVDGVTVSDNTTVYFKAVDAAGNESEVASCEVKNIDKIPPVKPTVTADVTTTTSGSVNVTATFSEDSVVKEYSLDNQTWSAYAGAVPFTKNGIIYFRGIDAVGNISEIASYTVSNISSGEENITSSGLVLSSGQSASVLSEEIYLKTIVSSGGILNVSSGGVASSTNIKQNGLINISSGGTANNTIFGNVGSMNIFSGGTADGNMIYADAKLFISNGGFAENNTIFGFMYVSSGGTASNNVVSNGGCLFVSSGGKANNTSLTYDGSLCVASGGTATDIAWTPCEGQINVEEGAVVSFISQYSGVYLGFGSHLISQATTMNSVTLTEGHEINVLSNGETNDVTINAYCSMYVSGGGIAKNTTVQGYSYGPGLLYVSSGGIARNTIISGAGRMYVFNGGVTCDAYINRGILRISSGGTASNTIISGGSFFISSGGKLTGQTTIASGAVVSVSSNAVLDFNISEVTPDADARINDLSRITDWTNAMFTLTVSSSQTNGVYTLANGVTGFNKTITITNASVTQTGTLSVGVTTTFGGMDYTLNLANGSLSVTVSANQPSDTIAPTVTNVKANITAATNQNVTVTATFSDDVGVTSKLYRIGTNGSWQTYENDVTVTENTTIFFKAVDTAGNESEVVTYKVGNIDKVAPSAPSGLMAVVSDQTIVLVWSPSTDNASGIKEYIMKYSCNGQEFEATVNNTNFVLTGLASGSWTWSVQAVDAVGNISDAVMGNAFTVGTVVPEPEPEPEPEKKTFVVKSDIDGNGVSDVMFVWTGEHGEGNYQQGYWMNGTATWQSANAAHPSDWIPLGAHDMNGNGKADSVMFGNVTSEAGIKGAYIGYYLDAVDTDSNWQNIGYLNNEEDIAWQNCIGNLTGNEGKNSIVWYASELFALGVWTDSTTDWVNLSASFGGKDWTLVGCGDFNNDGKDSVLMTYNGGQLFYIVGIDGAEPQSLGNANWSGWNVRAIGDFSGDGKDDIVLFHKETGSMVLCADGNIDNFVSIGQLAADDWFVVGAGDYNGNQKDDLLVRQYSTGMLGYYISGDTSQWVELGRGVGMEWTVIA